MAERADVVDTLARELRAKQSQIAELIVAEVGCAASITQLMQVGNPLRLLEAAIGHARREQSERLPIDVTPNPFAPDGPRFIGGTTVVREPIGVVSAITGYNFPFLLNLAKIGPALLAGCTMVLKPSPFTPFSALMFGRLADEIGLPPGVLNIVTGGIEEGQLLCTDERVDMVTFTGSEAVGAQIMGQAAPTLKKVHLELGGKSAMIVREDADVERQPPQLSCPSMPDKGAPFPPASSCTKASGQGSRRPQQLWQGRSASAILQTLRPAWGH